MLFGSSVELLVYLTIGIWRGPRTNKQYPTLEQYISNDCHMHSISAHYISVHQKFINKQQPC